MTNFEKKLKDRSKKIFEKIDILLNGTQKLDKRLNTLAKDFEKFADEVQVEKAKKIKEILKK